VARARVNLRLLERLLPTENGITVFDAETQETSYGIWFLDDLPFIFDTHRKDRRYVATVELLTEVVTPVRIAPTRVRRFGGECRDLGLLPLPYSGCYFKDDLHVYSFFGPVRGFDIAAAGQSVASVERALRKCATAVWPRVPREVLRAQRGILEGKRKVRHAVDLESLRPRWKERLANGP